MQQINIYCAHIRTKKGSTMSKILSYLCDKNICFYTRKHNCVRQLKQDIYIREHDIDEDTFGNDNDEFDDVKSLDEINFTDKFEVK